MVHSFKVNPTTTSPTVLSSTRKPFGWAIVQSQVGNTAKIRVVARQTDGTFPTTGGIVLAPPTGAGLPGASVLLAWMGVPLPYDFNSIAIILDVANEGVDVIYGS